MPLRGVISNKQGYAIAADVRLPPLHRFFLFNVVGDSEHHAEDEEEKEAVQRPRPLIINLVVEYERNGDEVANRSDRNGFQLSRNKTEIFRIPRENPKKRMRTQFRGSACKTNRWRNVVTLTVMSRARTD